MCCCLSASWANRVILKLGLKRLRISLEEWCHIPKHPMPRCQQCCMDLSRAHLKPWPMFGLKRLRISLEEWCHIPKHPMPRCQQCCMDLSRAHLKPWPMLSLLASLDEARRTDRSKDCVWKSASSDGKLSHVFVVQNTSRIELHYRDVLFSSFSVVTNHCIPFNSCRRDHNYAGLDIFVRLYAVLDLQMPWCEKKARCVISQSEQCAADVGQGKEA